MAKVKRKKGNLHDNSAHLKFIGAELQAENKCSDIGIYKILKDYNLSTVIGEELDNLTIEKYLSLSETSIFSNPIGISDNPKYKSRLITRFSKNQDEYLLTVSSFAFEGLTKKDGEKILKILKEEVQ